VCEKCEAIDERIAHYKRLARAITDPLMLERIRDLISQMDAEKAALHPEK
jgi:hypothetical protein